MKKFKAFLLLVAVVTAGAGVYAKEFRFTTRYYEDTSAPGTCNVEISPPCTEGTMVACKTAGGNNVWKIVDNGACEQVFKDL